MDVAIFSKEAAQKKMNLLLSNHFSDYFIVSVVVSLLTD